MKNKILIYDDNCPLCSWYSGLFVKYGFLDAENRKAFSAIDDTILTKIDFDKSRNEIPLVDTTTSKVFYGIDALLEILSMRIPFIKKIGKLSMINWMLKKLYRLISYNRKIVVAKKCGQGNIDCSPDLNYKYRSLFMALCLVFNTFMLLPLHKYLLVRLSYYNVTSFQLQTAHFIFVIINFSLALTFPKANAYEYLGQVNMLALTAILLLIPVLLINYFLFSELFVTAYLIIATTVIFKEYIRRMEYADILAKNKWIASMNLVCLIGFILFVFH